jgi:hypothetical protein
MRNILSMQIRFQRVRYFFRNSRPRLAETGKVETRDRDQIFGRARDETLDSRLFISVKNGKNQMPLFFFNF